ncbi:MAG: hypothetical protein MAGBODY4_00333 [Candidatus Marinimicrobia bacterium]|nr:hypothetical protein [Candidatus Neomarinimicrobiota bacterium]
MNDEKDQVVEDKQKKKKKKSIQDKYPTRQALVYSGAAFLIVIVGLRTLFSVADEGFGLIEYITMGGLALEFSMLLLYAWTIYQAGQERLEQKEEEEEEEEAVTEVTSEEMPQVATQLQQLSRTVGQSVEELREQNRRLESQFQSLQGVTENLQEFAGTDLQESFQVFSRFSQSSSNLLDQLMENEKTISEHSREINEFSSRLNDLIEEQIKLRIRQEIQRVLASAD